MTEIGDKLKEALEKANNVKTYIWKDKKGNDRTVPQVEHRLIDFDLKTLQEKLDLCEEMLYNTDARHPGRVVLLNQVNDQILRCRAELLVRWLRHSREYTSAMCLENIKNIIANNKDILNNETIKTMPIGDVMNGIEDLDLRNVPISLVLDACMDYLNIFDSSHITFTFITRMGLWFTPQELQTPVENGGLYKKDPKTGRAANRLELVKVLRRLNPQIQLRLDPTGLTYAEFKSMCDLHKDKYSNLTTNQLRLLSSKVLYRFQAMCEEQIKMWSDKIREIKEVAEHKGYTLSSKYNKD